MNNELFVLSLEKHNGIESGSKSQINGIKLWTKKLKTKNFLVPYVKIRK